MTSHSCDEGKNKDDECLKNKDENIKDNKTKDGYIKYFNNIKECSYNGVNYPFPGDTCPTGDEEKSYLKDLGRIYKEIYGWAKNYNKNHPCSSEDYSWKTHFTSHVKRSAYAQAILNPGSEKKCERDNGHQKVWFKVKTGGTSNININGETITFFNNNNWNVERVGQIYRSKRGGWVDTTGHRNSGAGRHNLNDKKWYEQ